MKKITGLSSYPEIGFCLDLENAPVAVTVAWEDGGIQFMEGPEDGCINGLSVSGHNVIMFETVLQSDGSTEIRVHFKHRGSPYLHTIGRTEYGELAFEWVKQVNQIYTSLQEHARLAAERYAPLPGTEIEKRSPQAQKKSALFRLYPEI